MAKLTADERKAVILTAGLRVARDTGLWSVTHSSVAKRCVVPTSAPTVKAYYATKRDLWSSIIDADDTGALRDAARELGWS